MHLRGKIPLLGALGTLLFGGHGVEALTLDVTNTGMLPIKSILYLLHWNADHVFCTCRLDKSSC